MTNNKPEVINGITKEQSVQLQGLAILLMIYHHFFNNISIYGGNLQFWNETWVVRFAWFGKICVGIFAFVSGYGLYQVLERKRRPAWKVCLRQAMQLLVRYWVVLIVFMTLFFALGKREFEIKEFLLNFFCLSDSYNGAFWYVGQYLIMLSLLFLYRLCGIWMIAGGAVWGILALVFPWARMALESFLDAIRISFVLVFFAGYFLARFKVPEKLFSKLSSFSYWVQALLGMVMMGSAAAVRMIFADSPAYAKLDFLLVPPFAIGFLLLVRGKAARDFRVFGNLSAWTWLTHLFVFDLTKDFFLKFLNRSHLAFFAAELICCYVTGLICYLIEKRIMKGKSREPN